MEEENKLHITLNVCNQDVHVRVNRDEEAYYRAAAKLITERYNAYAQKYNKGGQPILMMTLITIAFMYEKERTHNDTAPYDNVLARLTTEIDEALGLSR